MSADAYVDCPICGHSDCVRIDGVYDFTLKEDKTIDTKFLRGLCSMCGNGFGEYKDEPILINERLRSYHKCNERCKIRGETND